ncbi:2-hydroxychromene-2-carboxylate isomerase [Marinobacterium rhizophilum]|uniref:2-hydroxychromene-2-carboxylate isomerase n=1 Tax=Marinobacterium rhizophilum TaxID=420402 RepID=A0ABY5HK05_9GAMM|nr:2-hydroxychromene-2-carboxylate isomerase [Marinobacterium rhizophilum]UTW12142.1 2-hydroxychromene-2-carboxylate isomerase [Marinobacterium rhizophilum]
MTAKIDYYFTCISPFTFIGHDLLLKTAATAGAQVNFLPIRLGPVFAQSGAKPLGERPQSRRDYRLVELRRWAKKRGLALNLQPKFFPSDPALADSCVIALLAARQDPAEFAGRIMAACWVDDKRISDSSVVSESLKACGFDADAILAAAGSDATSATYDQNTEQALAQGILGAPAYVLNGEQFWGQDRLELLADALAETLSGRQDSRPA